MHLSSPPQVVIEGISFLGAADDFSWRNEQLAVLQPYASSIRSGSGL